MDLVCFAGAEGHLHAGAQTLALWLRRVLRKVCFRVLSLLVWLARQTSMLFNGKIIIAPLADSITEWGRFFASCWAARRLAGQALAAAAVAAAATPAHCTVGSGALPSQDHSHRRRPTRNQAGVEERGNVTSSEQRLG